MKNHYNKTIFLILPLLIILPQCGRIVDWAKSNFYQGETLPDYHKIPERYIRTVSIHNQINATATFTALLLTEQVRTAYSQSWAQLHGKSCEQEKTFLRRQLQENNHFISFYLLSLYTDKLTDSDAKWSVLLDINGCLYNPIEIKVVEMPIEYRSFFGRLNNRFKTAYLVKFDAKDIQGNRLLGPDVDAIKLCFRKLGRQAFLTWNLDEQGDCMQELNARMVKRSYEYYC